MTFEIDWFLRLEPDILVGPVELIKYWFVLLKYWRLFCGDFCESGVTPLVHLKVSVLGFLKIAVIRLFEALVVSLTQIIGGIAEMVQIRRAILKCRARRRLFMIRHSLFACDLRR